MFTRKDVAQIVYDLFGESILEEFSMNLGHPQTGEVEIDISESESPFMVWVHGVSGVITAIDGDVTDDEEDKSTWTRALCKPDAVQSGLLIYGAPVKVQRTRNGLKVAGLDDTRAAEFFYGLKERLQRSVDLSQMDTGLIRPTQPATARVLVTAYRCVLNDTAYSVPTLQSPDLIAAYEPGLSAGQAKAIMIESDPATATLYLTASAAFNDTTHELAFAANYPVTVAAGRFLHGWVKIYEGMEIITIPDIFAGQEFYGKGGSTTSDFVYYGNAPIYWQGKRITHP